MSMWNRKKEQPPQPSQESPQSIGTISLEDAEARTTAQPQDSQAEPQPQAAAPESEKLFVPDILADGLSRGVFWPGRKWIHRDMGLTDEETRKLNPSSRAAIQWAADKLLPAFLLRIANSASPLFDFLAVAAVLYGKKYEEIQKQEAARVDNAKRVPGVRIDENPEPPARSVDDLPLPGKPYSQPV